MTLAPKVVRFRKQRKILLSDQGICWRALG